MLRRALIAVVAVVGVALGGLAGRVLTCAADAGDLGPAPQVLPWIRDGGLPTRDRP